MTESRGTVEPPFTRRSVQLTIAAIALTAILWQVLALNGRARLGGRLDRDSGDDRLRDGDRWGELAGHDAPLIQIDLNRAGLQELSLLPGVGPVLAKRIVEDRSRLGSFDSPDSLRRVPGIGAKTVELIRGIGYVDREP